MLIQTESSNQSHVETAEAKVEANQDYIVVVNNH